MKKQNTNQFYNYLYIGLRDVLIHRMSSIILRRVRNEFASVYRDVRYELYVDLNELN